MIAGLSGWSGVTNTGIPLCPGGSCRALMINNAHGFSQLNWSLCVSVTEVENVKEWLLHGGGSPHGRWIWVQSRSCAIVWPCSHHHNFLPYFLISLWREQKKGIGCIITRMWYEGFQDFLALLFSLPSPYLKQKQKLSGLMTVLVAFQYFPLWFSFDRGTFPLSHFL